MEKKELQFPMKPVNMYACVHENRNGLRTLLERKENSRNSDKSGKDIEIKKPNAIDRTEETLIKIKNNALYKAEIKELVLYPFSVPMRIGPMRLLIILIQQIVQCAFY